MKKAFDLREASSKVSEGRGSRRKTRKTKTRTGRLMKR